MYSYFCLRMCSLVVWKGSFTDVFREFPRKAEWECMAVSLIIEFKVGKGGRGEGERQGHFAACIIYHLQMDIERNSWASRNSRLSNHQPDRSSYRSSVMSLERISDQRHSSLSRRVSLFKSHSPHSVPCSWSSLTVAPLTTTSSPTTTPSHSTNYNASLANPARNTPVVLGRISLSRCRGKRPGQEVTVQNIPRVCLRGGVSGSALLLLPHSKGNMRDRTMLSLLHRQQERFPAVNPRLHCPTGQQGQPAGGKRGGRTGLATSAAQLQEHALYETGLCEGALYEGSRFLHLQEVAVPEEVLSML